MLLTGLKNSFNGLESTMAVDVYSTDVREFVVITEPDDNPGPSITNAAETICPQIAGILKLDWRRCVFIESYPVDKQRYVFRPYDPSFDRICFAGPVERRYVSFHHGLVAFAPLGEPGWAPIPRDLAESLQQAGCAMSQLIGREANFWNEQERIGGRYHIKAYDGRRYYTAGGVFLPGDIRHVLGLDRHLDAQFISDSSHA